jgi:hypothetical protein
VSKATRRLSGTRLFSQPRGHHELGLQRDESRARELLVAKEEDGKIQERNTYKAKSPYPPPG